MNKIFLIFRIGFTLTLALWSSKLFAQTDSESHTKIKIEANAESTELKSGSLPPVYKNKIYNGKKSQVTQLSNQIQTPEAQNTRQILTESSGVIVTEVNNQSYYSIGIRGIGDPHESQSILLMSDDIPVAADYYGYPAAYYLPSPSAIESIEVTKTGAGLLYGSQPGGSLNYRLKQANYNSPVLFKTSNTTGSNQLFTTFNSVQGGQENLAYVVEGYQRTGAGQFKNNSGFNAYGFDSRLRYKINNNNELRNQLSYYKGRFEEAGGLALVPAAGRASIAEDLTQNTLAHDELLIDRFEARLSHEYQSPSQLNVTSTLWTQNLSRESRRQNGGGFGVLPVNNSNTIQDQDFYSTGARISAAQDYNLFAENQTFTANLTYYKMNSPIEIGTGSSADADTYSTLTRQLQRSTNSLAAAIENQFTYQKWTFTPSVRTEIIEQTIEEKFNGTPNLRTSDMTDYVTLGGVTLTYNTENNQQIYFSGAEGFRPIQYSESVPTSSNTVVNSDLKSSKTLATELGVKGQISHINYDVSVFSVNYKNQVGTITGSSTTTLGNVGEGQYEGIDATANTEINENFKTFANSQFLKARYISGPLENKTPAYAPHYLHKLGIQHEVNQLKHRLTAQFVEEHYSDDNNNTERKIPSYNIWDIAGEYTPNAKLLGADTKLNYGVNNIFDKKYYTRVRSNGIEPALERNFYAGVELAF